MGLRETGFQIADWFHLARDRDGWRTLVNMVLNLRVPYKAGEFPNKRSGYNFSRTLLHGVNICHILGTIYYYSCSKARRSGVRLRDHYPGLRYAQNIATTVPHLKLVSFYNSYYPNIVIMSINLTAGVEIFKSEKEKNTSPWCLDLRLIRNIVDKYFRKNAFILLLEYTMTFSSA
jgi:hypothetical protein